MNDGDTIKTAFIGLGTMGYPMAGHLASAGHDVAVYNRAMAKAEAWTAEHGGRHGATPREAADKAEMVFCCVGNDDDLRSVVDGEAGALAGMAAGSILVDHTTASAEVARELDEKARARGVHFIDAPVSGGEAGAQNGVLTVMCGGAEEPFDRAQPVMAAYGRAVTLLGDVGAGQLTKMVNQICIAGLLQGLAEGLNFAQRAGLDGAQVVDVISKGAAQSWQMENRGKTMLRDEFDFGFAVEWMIKDLGICLAEARRNGALLPVTAVVDQFYCELARMGHARLDTSSLMKRLTRE